MTAANISRPPVNITVVPTGGSFHAASRCIFSMRDLATSISIEIVENSSTVSMFPLRWRSRVFAGILARASSISARVSGRTPLFWSASRVAILVTPVISSLCLISYAPNSAIHSSISWLRTSSPITMTGMVLVDPIVRVTFSIFRRAGISEGTKVFSSALMGTLWSR